MDKSKINYIVDIVLGISFLAVAVTGMIRYFRLFGFRRADLANLHDLAGIIFVVLAAVHFVLHYRWIIVMTKNLFKK